MLNIIIIIGIILIKFSSKKQNKLLKNIGIFVVLICLIYVILSFFNIEYLDSINMIGFVNI